MASKLLAALCLAAALIRGWPLRIRELHTVVGVVYSIIIIRYNST